MAVGSEEFVDWVYERYRPEFGPGRKVGAKKVREVRGASSQSARPQPITSPKCPKCLVTRRFLRSGLPW